MSFFSFLILFPIPRYQLIPSISPILGIRLSDSTDINLFFAALKAVVVTCVTLSRANGAS